MCVDRMNETQVLEKSSRIKARTTQKRLCLKNYKIRAWGHFSPQPWSSTSSPAASLMPQSPVSHLSQGPAVQVVRANPPTKG